MKDTTFWPSECQCRRVVKFYKPKTQKTGLEAILVSQLQYPFPDRSQRYPMPAGGLLCMANDTARFCQMILNGGSFRRQWVSRHRPLSACAHPVSR